MKKWICLFVAFLCVIAGWGQQLCFDRFNLSNGLSQNNVYCLELGDNGDLWVGTLDGINRYNGYTFEIYKPYKKKAGNLVGNHVVALGKSLHGDMWALTRGGGLNLYHEASHRFELIDPSLFGTFAIEQVNRLVQSGDSLLWLNNHSIVGVWMISTQQFYTYETKSALHGMRVLDDNSVLVFGEFGIDRLVGKIQDGELIVVAETLSTVPCYGLLRHEGKQYGIQPSGIYSLCNDFSVDRLIFAFTATDFLKFRLNDINDFAQVDDDFWIGGYGFLIRFLKDGRNYHLEQMRALSSNKYFFKGHDVSRLIVDEVKNLWIGTAKNGLGHLNYLKNQFQHYSWDLQTITDPDSNPVRTICKTRDGDLWMGFDRQGIGILMADGTQHYFDSYYTQSNQKKTIRSVRSIFEDSEGSIWIGEFQNLCCFNPKMNRIETIDCRYSWKWPFRCYSIKEFEQGIVSITSQPYLGLVNLSDGSMTTLSLTKPTLNVVGTVRDMAQDKYNNLYFAKDDNGILKIAYPNFEYENLLAETHKLTNNKVYCMLVSGDSLWIGTNMGLNLFDIKKNKVVQQYFEEDGLCSNIIYSISSDKEGNLWMSTNKGVSFFDSRESVFRTYLSNDYFMDDAYFVDDEGEIYYGGYQGVISFHPEKITRQLPVVKPEIDLFLLNNEPVYSGDTVNGKVLFDEALSKLNDLDLDFTQNSFSLGFNAYPFDYPNSNRFRYRLKGYQDQWVDGNDSRMASYIKVPPGDYVFQVEAAPFFRQFEQVVELNVHVIPPFWMTIWFKIVLLTLVASLLILAYRFRIRQINQRNSWLKIKVEEQTAALRDQNKTIVEISDKLHLADQSKLRFFTNVSHELRTPLTLILGHLENMNDDSKSALASIRNNAVRLLKLINQLIDFRKMDQDQLKLSVSNFDFVVFVRKVVDSFQSIAGQKEIQLSFNSMVEKLEVWLDVDKMEKILYNLMSNAIKYSSNKTSIDVSIDVSENDFRLSVSDSGIGIKEEEQEHVFDRFYRTDNGQNNASGHGIGLSMVKGLTQIQHGEIEVDSRVGEGSCFNLCFLKGKSHFSSADFGSSHPDFIEPETQEPERFVLNDRLGRKKLLIVEDNEELANFLAHLWDDQFTLKMASNGKVALEVMKHFVPDLILSDIMMPEMDGIVFCQKVKSKIETSHIPVILLTAKSGAESQISGFEHGADDYIEKPFHTKVLKARVNALLLNRQVMMEQFFNSAKKIPSTLNVSTQEQEFLDRINSTIDASFSDANFSVELLSEKLNMSRATFYRKFTGLTGTKPADYIRKVRLRNAYRLLCKNDQSVLVVSENVGFSSVSHFRKCFKEEFGCTPSAVHRAKI